MAEEPKLRLVVKGKGADDPVTDLDTVIDDDGREHGDLFAAARAFFHEHPDVQRIEVVIDREK